MIPLILAITATVSVDTTPPGGWISIDGKPAGQAPLEVALNEESHVIGAELGALTGAYIIRDTAPTAIHIVMFEAPQRRPEDVDLWHPSWSGTLLGVGLIGFGFYSGGGKPYEAFVPLAAVLSGVFIAAMSIGGVTN